MRALLLATFDLNPGIAGGARCSATDYLKFLRMVSHNGQGANGRVVLSSRSVQEFFTNQTFGLPDYYSPAQDSDYYAYDQPWAPSPFLESLARPPGPRLYYRVRR